MTEYTCVHTHTHTHKTLMQLHTALDMKYKILDMTSLGDLTPFPSL